MCIESFVGNNQNLSKNKRMLICRHCMATKSSFQEYFCKQRLMENNLNWTHCLRTLNSWAIVEQASWAPSRGGYILALDIIVRYDTIKECKRNYRFECDPRWTLIPCLKAPQLHQSFCRKPHYISSTSQGKWAVTFCCKICFYVAVVPPAHTKPQTIHTCHYFSITDNHTSESTSFWKLLPVKFTIFFQDMNYVNTVKLL